MKYTVTFLPAERRCNFGGYSVNTFPDRPIGTYFCWLWGGHKFVEYSREYHYDSSETAHCRCSRCGLRASF